LQRDSRSRPRQREPKGTIDRPKSLSYTASAIAQQQSKGHRMTGKNEHFVQFYDNDAFLIDEVAGFIGGGLKSGEAGIVIATAEHRERLHASLTAELARRRVKGINTSASRLSGPYIALDAEETLAAFMVDGWPDGRRFSDTVAPVVAKAALAGNGRVRAFGEMVALLWARGQRDAALRLEDLWNGLTQSPCFAPHSFSLLCAYPMGAFAGREDAHRLRAVCEAHGHVEPAAFAAALHSEADARSRVENVLKQREHELAGLRDRLVERDTRAAELERRAEELAADLRRKDEFVTMLGHELRNPLAPVAAALELLRLGSADAATVERARRIIERQFGVMSRMVDDLLDASRMSSGKVELKREKVLLGTVIERAVEMVRPLMDEKRHTLRINAPQLPVMLDADPVRLAQVLANLLDNAAKYTDPDGLIVLTAREETGGELSGSLTVSVRDNGMGLDARLREEVFDLFVQGAPESRRGGLGIGLAVVRRIVQLHGGTVFVRSDGPRRGSEFVFRLPLPVSESAAAIRRSRKPAAKPRRILVVDDNADAAQALAECLRVMAHHVTVARDGASAIEQALLDSPDLVILDIGMPEMDGYELARRLRALPQLRSTVFVALTGYAEDGDVTRALQSGFDHHFAKPLDLPKLAALIDTPRPKRRAAASRQPRLNLQ
jgi:signal transduction histidine kinase/ActR/RegA family two-component response regulator